MINSDVDLTNDIERIQNIPIIATLLDVICQTTGMGFAAVARVTPDRWVACQVRDDIQFGLTTGGELPLGTTLCQQVYNHQQAIIIDHVQHNQTYWAHPTPVRYGFQSYISFPIVLTNGEFFGTLCAIDTRPAQLDTPKVKGLFTAFAELISFHIQQLDLLEQRQATFTQQEAAHQRIQESEARLRSLVEEAPVATCLYMGPNLVIELANEPMIRFFGCGPSIVGKAVRSVLTAPGPHQSAIALLEQVLLTGDPFTAQAAPAELIVDGQAGTYYFDLSLKPLRRTSGEIYAILQTAVDVTAEVVNRRKLEASETYFRRLTDTVPTIIWETAPDGYCTYLNHQWYVTTGQTQAQAEGFGWLEATHPDDQPEASRLFLTANQRRMPFSALYRLRQTNGSYRWALDLGSPRFSETGRYEGMIGTVVDVHEQVLARQEIEASEARLRSLSASLDQQVQVRTEQLQTSIQDLQRSNENLQQFASIASHDLQEPLRKIQSFSDLLKTQYGDALGEGVVYLERMQSAAGRMSTLIKDLLAYSRISTQQDATGPVALGAVVEGVLSDLEIRIGETGAQVTLESLPTVPGDGSQLGQLFQNLISNALKFRRPGVAPLIRVSCQRLPAGALPPSVRPTRSAPTYYHIEVADNGIGFEQKYVERMFQIFQRLHSKNEYAGTGIGLAICAKVVANHGGAIRATSQSGQGATFGVYLPVEEAFP